MLSVAWFTFKRHDLCLLDILRHLRLTRHSPAPKQTQPGGWAEESQWIVWGPLNTTITPGNCIWGKHKGTQSAMSPPVLYDDEKKWQLNAFHPLSCHDAEIPEGVITPDDWQTTPKDTQQAKAERHSSIQNTIITLKKIISKMYFIKIDVQKLHFLSLGRWRQ